MSKKKKKSKKSRNKRKKFPLRYFFYDKPGTYPGTLNIDKDAEPSTITLIDYNALEEKTVKLTSPDEAIPYISKKSVTWVDIQSLGSEEVLTRTGEIFHLHPLVLEDVANVPQRSKVDDYEKHLLITTQMVRPEGKDFSTEQVSFVLGDNYLLTFQEEGDHDSFDSVRDMIALNKGAIRQKKTDYLAYSLIDAIIDGYFPVLELYGRQLEVLEEEVVMRPTSKSLKKIYYLKRKLLELRRLIWPMRKVINVLAREDNKKIRKEVRIFFRDCYDHAVEVMEMLETYRELTYSLMEVYMSSMGNKMNEIMKLLTVISTIFIPLTFLTGLYGMNFDKEISPFNMPELNCYWGYPIFWLVTVLITLGLIYFFWHKGWFEKTIYVEKEENPSER